MTDTVLPRLVRIVTRSAGARRRADDRGSLPLAMLIVVSGLGLSMALSSTVVAQLTATRTDIGRADALNAAQAGLDVVAAHVRAATDNQGEGRLGRLPCNEVSGAVGGPAAPGGVPVTQAAYRVRVQYFQFNPANTTADNPELTCYDGSGTPKVPGYAVLTSTGADGRPNGTTRTINATYVLRTTNENIPGGLIHVWKLPTATIDLCLDAGPVMPTAANTIDLRVQVCDPKSLRQKFAYHSNLSLAYVPSKTNAMPLGMCLDAGASPVDRAPVRFRPCTTTTSRQQQWSFTDARNFVGTNATNDFNDLCFNMETPNTANSRIILRHVSANGCYVGPDNNTQMFAAEAPVGAGAAENSPNQLVNFAQFGRCLDVTMYNVTTEYLISYPCKQAPKPEKVNWNQRFIVPTLSTAGEVTSGTGRIYTYIAPGDYEKSNTGKTGDYCLTTATVTTTNPYVTVSKCLTPLPNHMRWKVVRKSTTYSLGYRIETTVAGKTVCMAAAGKPEDLAPDGMSKIVMEPCTDSTLQKWNAPAYVRDPSPMIDFRED